MPFKWAVFAAVVLVVVLLLLAIGAWIGRLGERRRARRGGTLEFSSPEARAAFERDPDDWFDPAVFRAGDPPPSEPYHYPDSVA